MGWGSISQTFWRRRFCFYSCRGEGVAHCPPPSHGYDGPENYMACAMGSQNKKNTIGMYKVCWQVDTNPNWVRENLLQGSIHILRKHITFLGLWTPPTPTPTHTNTRKPIFSTGLSMIVLPPPSYKCLRHIWTVPKEIWLDICEKFVRIRAPKNQEFCELKSS